MLKKSITYTDFNGSERTEDFYFNLTKAEIMEMEMGITGGLAAKIQNIINAQDMPSLIAIFKDLILRSYGVKTPDGRGFQKRDGERILADEFAQTEAYSVLFMELATNAEAATAFINGIVPADVAKQAALTNSENK